VLLVEVRVERPDLDRVLDVVAGRAVAVVVGVAERRAWRASLEPGDRARVVRAAGLVLLLL
jgi:hypothetical protein